MKTDDINKMQGHSILALMGKKVLRPGGKELTLKLIENLNINSNDNVVEFAPGTGFTSNIILKNKPKSYTGIELDEDVASQLQDKISDKNGQVISANAKQSGLVNNYYDKVFGEAMLTMQSDNGKKDIIKEAYRILKTGGLYAIHELCLFPDEMDAALKSQIQKDLAIDTKVNAKPLTRKEWIALLENEGFKINKVITNPMKLLDVKRIMGDEGFFSSLNIAFNMITHPKAKRRIAMMRSVFQQYRNQINAVVIIAEKIN